MPAPAILSDIGNVLVTFDFHIAAARVAERCPHPVESLFTRLDAIKGPYENGDMNDTDFIREAIDALDFEGSAEEFATIWCEIFAENTPMVHTLTPFQQRLPLYLLSNTSGLHKDYLFNQFNIFRAFQGGVYSYSAKCSKPGETIFQIAIERFQLNPAETFYIDDLPANIDTAKRLGFQTHLYASNNHAQLEKELHAWADRALG